MRCLFACCFSLCALTAAAQVRRVAAVGISLQPAGEADAAYGARAVSAFIQGDPRFEWVSPAIQARDDGPRREAKGLEARRVFTEGRDELDNLNAAKALVTLEKSIKYYEDSDLSVGVSGLLEALSVRAIAALAKGDKTGFSTDAQRVLAINPDYVFDPSRLTPAAQAALEPLRKKVKAAPPATLELVSTPPNAWAYVDGTFRGATPITVPGLAPGSHVVTLVLTGFELVQEKVFAGSGPAPAFTLKSSSRGKEVLARIGELRAALERNEPGAAAGTLASFIQAEELLVAVVKQGKELAVIRVLSDGLVIGELHRPLSAQTAIADWQAMVKELLAINAPAPKKVEPLVVVVEDARSSGSRAGRRPFAWAGVGLTVAAAGAGAGLGFLARSTAQTANRTPQVDAATYNQLASSARTQGYAADTMFGLTAALGAVSIFLLVTGYSDDAPSEPDEEASLVLGPGTIGLRGSF